VISKETESEESVSESDQEEELRSFDCPVEGCTNRYISYANLLRHTMGGKHGKKLEKHSLIDKSKTLFYQNLLTNHTRTTPSLSLSVVSSASHSMTPKLTEGWASQKIKPNTRFNDKQKQFLQDKFDEGVQSGSE
jgi:hypothetical protein